MVKSDLTVDSNRGCLINGPRGSRGLWRQSWRQRAAVWASWKGRPSPPISETRANRPWQRPTAIKGPINPQLLCEGGRGRRETRSCWHRAQPPHAGGSWAPGLQHCEGHRETPAGQGLGQAGLGDPHPCPCVARSIDPASLRSPELAERPAAGSALREAFRKGKNSLGQGPRCLLG